jgi:uncharacterized UBP type Zn finger protein
MDKTLHTSAAPVHTPSPLVQAQSLRELTEDTFSMLDCQKALIVCGNNVYRAADWLTSGKWRGAKRISWNQASLDAKAAELNAQTAKPLATCREALMDCNGHLGFATRRLLNQPQPWNA